MEQAMHTEVESRLGSTVGQYRLLRVLGTGGTSTVYLGRREDDPRVVVAVKILAEHAAGVYGDQASFRLRFLREARAASRLSHEHILPVLSFGETDGVTYMVLPAVAGTLADQLAGAPLPLPTIAAYLTQVASALDYAHERGIVHRDIKPSNILLDAHEWLYLADFGIARLFGSGANALTHDGSATLTNTGQVLGTPYYMAPEQIRGEPVGPATDVYALGVVIYQLVTGQVPFRGEMPLAVVVQHMLEAPPPPHLRRPELPTLAQAALLRSLAKQPADRFASAGAFAEAFAAGLAAMPSSVEQADPDTTQPAATPPVGFALPAAALSPPLAHAAYELPDAGDRVNSSPFDLTRPGGRYPPVATGSAPRHQGSALDTPYLLAAPAPRPPRRPGLRARAVLGGLAALALLGALLAVARPLPFMPWFSASPTPTPVSRHGSFGSAGSSNVSSTIATPTDVPTATATATAAPATLTAVAVTPAHVRLAKGETKQFKATGVYSDGGRHDITNSLSWRSSDNSVVSITQSGLATAVGAGTATVKAVGVGVVSNQVTVNVLPVAALTRIAITPATVPGGQNASGTVTLSDPAPAGGAVVTLTSANTDPSIKTALAQVPPSVTVPAGQLTSPAFPITTAATSADTNVKITATYAGVSQQATLAVTALPPPCTVPINDTNPHPYIASVALGPSGSTPIALPPQTKEGTSDGHAGSVTHYFCSAGTAASISTSMTSALQAAGWTSGSGSYPGGGCDWSLQSGTSTWCLNVSIADPANWTMTTHPPM